MSKPFFSHPARRDLLEILEYIAKDNPQAAVTFVKKLEDKCFDLARNPDMGFLRDELTPGLRVWPVGNYLIFYRPVTDGIDVIRVIHGARDLDKLFD